MLAERSLPRSRSLFSSGSAMRETGGPRRHTFPPRPAAETPDRPEPQRLPHTRKNPFFSQSVLSEKLSVLLFFLKYWLFLRTGMPRFSGEGAVFSPARTTGRRPCQTAAEGRNRTVKIAKDGAGPPAQAQRHPQGNSAPRFSETAKERGTQPEPADSATACLFSYREIQTF